jgi:hypothetical protein
MTPAEASAEANRARRAAVEAKRESSQLRRAGQREMARVNQIRRFLQELGVELVLEDPDTDTEPKGGQSDGNSDESRQGHTGA